MVRSRSLVRVEPATERGLRLGLDWTSLEHLLSMHTVPHSLAEPGESFLGAAPHVSGGFLSHSPLDPFCCCCWCQSPRTLPPGMHTRPLFLLASLEALHLQLPRQNPGWLPTRLPCFPCLPHTGDLTHAPSEGFIGPICLDLLESRSCLEAASPGKSQVPGTVLLP